jgi:hypothetical protein
MLRKGFGSIDDFRGLLAVPNDVDGAAYERQGYVAALYEGPQLVRGLRSLEPLNPAKNFSRPAPQGVGS